MSSPAPARAPLRGLARAYFDAAARAELLLPRCRECAKWSWPPRARCPECSSRAIEWARASGRGAVHTFTIVRQAADPSYATQLPYTIAMIDVDEGPRLLSRVVDCDVGAVRIGMRVSVTFASAADGLAMPVFRPSA
jgi:uncharacterized OB-fold protein